MRNRINRREVLIGAGAWACARTVGAEAGTDQDAAGAIAALELREGGRLGVMAVDTATGRRLEHRADERFPLCSTFKFLAAAAILHRVDRGRDHLDRWIAYGESDLLEYAPISKAHVKEGGMVLGDVCSAAVELSDNTAANLLLKILGGPEALTAFIRNLGDSVTRIDGFEPVLNVVSPGDVHDTTTPSAMVGSLTTILLGQVLSPDSRDRLKEWMTDAKVGEHRIRAGLPPGWVIAHKTGTWDNQANDVGLIWPPDRAPIVLATFYIRNGTRLAQREGVLRDVGRIVARGI